MKVSTGLTQPPPSGLLRKTHSRNRLPVVGVAVSVTVSPALAFVLMGVTEPHSGMPILTTVTVYSCSVQWA